jgi:hypothetical protein
MKDVGTSFHDNTTQNTRQPGDIKIETFTPPTYHAMGAFQQDIRFRHVNYILTSDNKQYLYIFPAWPDTLGYTYEQVFVNHNLFEQNNPYGILKNTDY